MSPSTGERRYRLSPGQYGITLALVNREQQGRCFLCHQPGIEELHHDCHDKTCRDPTHWRGVHAKCNQSEQNRQRLSRESVKGQREREKEEWPETYEVRRHIQLETDFDKALTGLLKEGSVTVKDAENRIAKITGSTQVVVRRWIDRENTPEGSIYLSERQVQDGRKTKTEQFINRKSKEGDHLRS